MPDEWSRERSFLLTVLRLLIAFAVLGVVIVVLLSFTSYGVASVLATAAFFVLVLGWALRGTRFDVYAFGEERPQHSGWRERGKSAVVLVFAVSLLLAFRTEGAAQVVLIGDRGGDRGSLYPRSPNQVQGLSSDRGMSGWLQRTLSAARPDV